MTRLRITRAGPLCTVQDLGRPGLLRHGVSASGPMDRAAFARAGYWIGGGAAGGIEFTTAGLSFVVEEGGIGVGADGGHFVLHRNGRSAGWPTRLRLRAGDTVEVTPGERGNYGYLRFDRDIELAEVLGSRSTNLVAGLGGLDGRSLRADDIIPFGEEAPARAVAMHPRATAAGAGPIRVLWGLHADLFPAEVRAGFVAASFEVSAHMDRMGARLIDREGVFSDPPALSLVSDAIVPGDIQILGDGTPIVLLRDHQPTGGYPRIATVISADLDRFVQLRPGAEVRFQPVTLDKAHAALLEAGA